MTVLSLFDGISVGRLALERAGIKVDKYYASEIDPYAINITMKNYPDTIQLGDIRNVKGSDLPKIDLLIGGFCCQSFSVAGKQLNFEDPRGKLFFEYVRLLKEVKPTYFLAENVKMKQEYQDVISEYLGVKPILIDSARVSAQRRHRLYWHNIPNITQPKDKGIMLKDIVLENTGIGADNHGQRTMIWNELEKYIVPFDTTLKIMEKEVEKGKIGYFRQDSQANRVYSIHGKAVTLCGSSGGGAARMGQYLFGCITPERINKSQNGQRFSEGDKFYTLTTVDRHGILISGYIRKLTPLECERLQTLQENFTKLGADGKQISDSQRYRCLGNSWTCDVISHIFSFMDRSKLCNHI